MEGMESRRVLCRSNVGGSVPVFIIAMMIAFPFRSATSLLLFLHRVPGRTRAQLPLVALLALACFLAGCAAPDTRPTNAPLALGNSSQAAGVSLQGDDTAIVLTFSGGGARSAAFGYGVLSSLARTPSASRGRSLADDVVVVGGVSGGAMLAAYFALHGPTGLPDFQRDFLASNAEASLHTSFGPANLLRGYRGGVNDRNDLPPWLDANLYHGATLGMLDRPGRPRLVIHATDLYNRTPFIFDRASFAAICSNFNDYPLAYAVAASTAVPVAFAPISLRNYRSNCPPDAAAGIAMATKPTVKPVSLVEEQYQQSLDRYGHVGNLNFLKLYDGGLVDNIGSQTLLHLMNREAPEPLPAENARRIRHLLFVVVDASTRIGGSLSETTDSPYAMDTLVAATDAVINIPGFQSFDELRRRLPSWAQKVVAWRCREAAARASCRDLDVSIIRVALSDVEDPVTAHRILGLHNTLTLKPADAIFLRNLGGALLARQPGYQRFLARLSTWQRPNYMRSARRN
ncbi:patatin-like phospholipase family protein [Mesorhizobium sp. NPDC059054]|uniref:patatin-like phospholipase family protein n=1 Tax=Mesorhizobium sp. NPDC059054 TaxID=3346711 RepID=UPI003696346D